MKVTGLWIGVLAVSLCRLSAQVKVEVVLNQEQFLPSETLQVEVQVANRSGQTLHLGGDPGWLTFSVEGHDSHVVPRTGIVPVVGEFTLPSSKRALKRVDLAPYFSLTKAGHYSVTATVTIKEWKEQFVSKPAEFDIIDGTPIWEQEVGVPNAARATNRPPELRKYALQEANYLKQLMLYLQVTDDAGRIYKVFPIGPMLSFGQPEARVDNVSNLHVLYQDGPHSFSYTEFTPNGDLILRQTYDYTTRPRFAFDKDNRLQVIGGRRRIMPNDVPPPKTSKDDVRKSAP